MTNQGFLGARGIAVAPAKRPFWKPSDKWTDLVIQDVRAPAEPEKLLPDGKTIVRTLLEADVVVAGVEKRWELTSIRAVAAVNSLPVDFRLPGQVHVRTVGKGKDQTTEVQPGSHAPQARIATTPCDAPGCTQALNHTGRHTGA